MKHLIICSYFAICAFASGEIEKSNVVRDGVPLETAVVIQVERQSDSPAAEWAWIEKNLPGARHPEAKPVIMTEDDEEIISMAHSLLKKNGQIYSALLVCLPNGSERVVYFDITSCFGK